MDRLKRAARKRCALVALGALIGVSALQAQVVLYVPALSGNQLWEYSVTSGTGNLVTYATPGTQGNSPNVVAVTPNNRFMYAGDQDGNIDAYLVNYDGQLDPVAPPLAQAGGVRGMAIDPTGKFLYTSYYFGNELRCFSINQTTGKLAAIPANTVALGASTNPRGMTIDRNGHLYVALSGAGTIGQFAINGSTGALTAIAAPLSNGAGGSSVPDQVAVNPAGTFLYGTNYGADSITQYSIASGTGALSSLGVLSTGSVSFPLGVAVHSNGNFVMVTLNSPVFPNNVLVYQIQGNGTLSLVSSGAAGSSATGVTMDPSGRYVYVSNAASNTISRFVIDQGTGAITSPAPTTFATGNNPQFLLSRPLPTAPAVPAASNWSLAGLGMLLAASSAFLYRRAYR